MTDRYPDSPSESMAKDRDEAQQDNALKGTNIAQSFFIIPYSVFYTGQWRDGKPHGLGQVVFQSGSVLNATFDRGSVLGNDCLYVMNNGSYYRGSIKDNKFSGTGIFQQTNGHIYQGQWHNNVPQGPGRQTFQNGDKYVGSYINGNKSGENSVYYWKNNRYYQKYQGSFSDNYFSGHGKIFLRDGTSITGLFYEGKVKKSYLENDQYEYEGDIQQGKLSGQGKIKFHKNKCQYQGNFKDGQIHGFGTFTDEKGRKKIGKWFKGTHVRQQKNLTDQQLQKLIDVVNQSFCEHKHFEQGLEGKQILYHIIECKQRISRQSKQDDLKYTVKQLSDYEISKINNHKFCVLEVNDNLIGILA